MQLDTSSPTAFFATGQADPTPLQLPPPSQGFSMLTPTAGLPLGHPGLAGQKYYTIQRVNGNGGNGKGDGVAGPHKHTLEDSDRLKRNSVVRSMLKGERERKMTQVS